VATVDSQSAMPVAQLMTWSREHRLHSAVLLDEWQWWLGGSGGWAVVVGFDRMDGWLLIADGPGTGLGTHRLSAELTAWKVTRTEPLGLNHSCR
jgi:hypothetical protein